RPGGPASRISRRRRRRRRAGAPTALGVGGGMLLFGGGLFGTWSAEQLHRWSVTYATDDANAPALPAGIKDRDAYNQAAIMARPTWQSQAWQWGLTIFTGLVGLFVPWRPVKLLLYGTALGSGLHAGYQLINGYIMLPQ